jgi:hypothetical protein
VSKKRKKREKRAQSPTDKGRNAKTQIVDNFFKKGDFKAKNNPKNH